jgi:adenylate cyclase
MGLLTRIEDHMALEGDTEVRRSQKRLTMLVMIPFVLLTGVHSVSLYSAGLVQSALCEGVITAVMLLAWLAIITFPKTYNVVAIIVCMTLLVANSLSHYLTGGFTSGLLTILWIVAVPVLSAIFTERRQVLPLMVAFTLTVVAVALLEDAAGDNLQVLDPNFKTIEASSNLFFTGVILAGLALYLFGQVQYYHRKANELLLNVLPETIAERLKSNTQTIADGYEDVTVLFADIVDFTGMSSAADPVDVVQKLNEVFSDLDALVEKYGLEKIKTIGDAYMVAGGLPLRCEDHCDRVVRFAVEMLATIERHRSWSGEPMRVRIGINCGPVVAGVIGQQKFIYDLWGDTVNVASRMESFGLANEIQVTQAVKERMDGWYRFDERGPIEVKGKGEMVTYLLQPTIGGGNSQ